MDLLTILTQILDKTLFVGFFLSCLVIIRQIFLFIRHLNNPEPKPYEIDKKTLFHIGLSIAVLLTGIIKGIGL
jgi:preprotein translocase subunit Sec61beta